MPALLSHNHLVFRCEVCGAPACFGFGVQYRAALKAREDGQDAKAREFIGRWFCGSHVPAEEVRAA